MQNTLTHSSINTQAHSSLNALNYSSMESLDQRVVAAIKHAKTSAAKLSRCVGCSESTVSLWVNGPTQTIDTKWLFKAARCLGVNAEWLATGEGEMELPKGGARLNAEGLAAGEKYQELLPHQRRVVNAIYDTFSLEEPDKETG